MAETKTLTAQCYCKAVHFTVTLPTASLPLKVHLCGCSICRYTHGTLSVFHATLPSGVEPQFVAPSSAASLTGYQHAASRSERFFCTTCGCHIGDASIDEDTRGEWNVASSVFDDHGEANFRITSHCLSACLPGGADAGGFEQLLTHMGDRELKVWNPPADDPEWNMEVVQPAREVDAAGNERLRAECHCGGVSFTIPRPTAPAVVDDEYFRGWVSPFDKNKWTANLDVCDDCRLVDGTHVVPWTFVPRALLDPPMPPALAPYGTMKAFTSSPGVVRGFCGTCGATVVYSYDDRAPDEARAVVDIAVGVLRAPDGVLAEDWLTWRTGRLSWAESGRRYDAVFAKSLEEGFAKWGERRHGKAVDFKLGP